MNDETGIAVVQIRIKISSLDKIQSPRRKMVRFQSIIRARSALNNSRFEKSYNENKTNLNWKPRL
jgi:hypothetical protein